MTESIPETAPAHTEARARAHHVNGAAKKTPAEKTAERGAIRVAAGLCTRGR